ncbi:MAG: GH25 family lysozyme [Acetatifactor sp.]
MKRLFNHTKRPEQEWEGYDESEYDWDSADQDAEDEEGGYYAESEDMDAAGEYYEEGIEGEESYAGEESGEGEEYYAEETAVGGEYYAEEPDEGEAYYAGETEEGGEYYAEEETVPEEYYAEESSEDEVSYAEETDDDGEYYEQAQYTGEDALYEGETYAGEEAYASVKKQRNAGQKKPGFFKKLQKGFCRMSAMDRVIMATGVGVLILALVTGSVFVSSRIVNNQVSDFVNVGKQLDGITTIGEAGLLAVADAQLARIAAASTVIAEEEKNYEEKTYEREVTVSLSMTSIQKDLKVKFINKKTDKLVANVPFAVTVTDPGGNTSIWSDDDMDGIIYKKDITPGTYKVAMEELTDSKYADYVISTASETVEVKKDIAYQKVDVANEVKAESEINVSKEDTKKNETTVESTLKDTVTWVDSKIIDATYNEISKSDIPDPLTLVLNKSFMRMSGTVTPGDNPTPTPAPSTPTPAPTATPIVGTISFNPGSVSVRVGSSATAAASVSGFGATGWTAGSADASVATASIGNDGKITVTGVKAGSTEIWVNATGANNATASGKLSVTVVGNKKITLDKTSTTVFISEPVTINATIENATASDPVVTAESSDTGIATVSVNKRAVTITGVKAGSCTITVKYTENGEEVSASCTVTVKNHPKYDTTTRLKDSKGNQLYVNDNGTYREATYADYYTYDKFYTKGATKYSGWQTLDGKVYFFTADGNKVTGEQVIQGAKYNFASDGSLVTGSGTRGIDVSKWNGTIDWTAVKNSGIEYVIIRCGYRGSSQGSLIEDPKYASNIKGATAAGLKVGVYFFTQAIDEREAVEEASMVLEKVKNYKISYPIFLDVEPSGGRADSISKETRTAVCKAFCQTIQNAGYTAGVYANKTWLETKIDASSLSAYKIWLAQYAATPTYTGRYDLWQYRSTGSVTGISGNVDMNISYLGY